MGKEKESLSYLGLESLQTEIDAAGGRCEERFAFEWFGRAVQHSLANAGADFRAAGRRFLRPNYAPDAGGSGSGATEPVTDLGQLNEHHRNLMALEAEVTEIEKGWVAQKAATDRAGVGKQVASHIQIQDYLTESRKDHTWYEGLSQYGNQLSNDFAALIGNLQGTDFGVVRAAGMPDQFVAPGGNMPSGSTIIPKEVFLGELLGRQKAIDEKMKVAILHHQTRAKKNHVWDITVGEKAWNLATENWANGDFIGMIVPTLAELGIRNVTHGTGGGNSEFRWRYPGAGINGPGKYSGNWEHHVAGAIGSLADAGYHIGQHLTRDFPTYNWPDGVFYDEVVSSYTELRTRREDKKAKIRGGGAQMASTPSGQTKLAASLLEERYMRRLESQMVTYLHKTGYVFSDMRERIDNDDRDFDVWINRLDGIA